MKLLVIAKSPVAGRSKTRLCPPCTPEEAASVAEAAIADTLDVCRRVGGAERVLVLEGAAGPWAEGYRVIPQRGNGLDERLAHAFADAGQDADGSLLIGMDTPQVTDRLLARAMETLMQPGIDGVLGPAADGGWWAMGVRTPMGAHVLGIPMSSPETLAHQRARWASLEMRYEDLPELRDIDTFSDAAAVAAMIPGSRTAAIVRNLSHHLTDVSR